VNAQTREQLRLSLLRFLDENPTRFGLGLPLLAQRARAEGFPVDTENLDAELLYLEDAKFVVQPAKVLSPENRTFRITKEGRDFRAQSA
jgi:hypothetical protein